MSKQQFHRILCTECWNKKCLTICSNTAYGMESECSCTKHHTKVTDGISKEKQA